MAAEIHKLQKNGVTIYPATTTDAVVDPDKKKSLKEIILDLNNDDEVLRSISVQQFDLNSLEYSSNIVLSEEGFYNKETGEFTSNASFRSTKIDCKEGDIYQFNGDVKYSSLAAIIMFDDQGRIYKIGDSPNADTKKINVIVRIPEHIISIAFSSYTTNSSGIVKKLVFKKELTTKEELSKFYPLLDINYNYEIIDAANDGFLKVDGTVDNSLFPGEFSYSIFEVEKGDIIRITTSLRGSGVAGVVYFNAQNEAISAEHVGTSWGTNFNVDDYIIINDIVKKIGITIKKPNGSIKKFTNLKDEEENEEVDFSELFDIDSLDKEQINLTKGIFYDYRDIKKGEQVNASFSGLKLEASPGDMFSYTGVVAYSAIAAVTFVDKDLNTISYLYGENTSSPKRVETGLIKCPNKCAYIVFGAYTPDVDSYTIFRYSYPKVITPNNVSKYSGAKIKYCNPYHFPFNGIIGSEFSKQGFETTNSNIPDSFVIHDKIFKSYRRKFEWKFKANNGTKLIIGTTSQNSQIAVTSRHSKIGIDLVAKKLILYSPESGGDTEFSTANINYDVNDNDVLIVRCSQYDYTLKVSLIKESTLEEVSVEEKASYTTTKCGKLIGRPFFQLKEGNVTLVEYNVFLLYNPLIVIVGDSITECGYRQNSYSARIIERNLNNDGCIVAQGGATIDSLAASLNSEIIHMKPKYLSLLAGTNVGITSENIQTWKDFCETNGIIFIINRVPVSLNKEEYPWAEKNQTIRNSGILGANFDIATAIDNDPSLGGNSDLFGDNVHPNDQGQELMYNRFLSDVPLF